MRNLFWLACFLIFFSTNAIAATEIQKLTASDAAESDFFGTSVSISGGYAIVSAPRDDDGDESTGSAYILEQDPEGAWSEAQKLTASDAAYWDFFGYSVSISGDYAIVGAYRDDDAGSASGSAYIFERDAGGAWSEVQKLTASDAGSSDEFGYTVSISGDYAIVGAFKDSDAGTYSGSAYIFERDAGGVWSEVQKLTASDAAYSDYFGYTVSVSGDYAIVGAWGKYDGGSYAGSAYIFERNLGGVWSETQKLTGSDAVAGHNFGFAVSISGDYAVVGARGDDDGGSSAGAAYVFERNAVGVWSEAQKLTASDAAASDWFGYSVSVSGNLAVVGAHQHDDQGSDSGASYAYLRDAAGVWSQIEKLTASDGAAGDSLGSSVSISGNYVIAGANYDDDDGTSSGSAYSYCVIDTDGDGFCDILDDFPADPAEWVDTDGDGTGDNADPDDDGDGYDDGVDAFPLDPAEWLDTDGDGVGDNADDFPTDPTETTDTDGDGTGDNTDPDDDGDGYDDGADAFPLDPTEWLDTDGDGTGDNADLDADDDGILDAAPDNCPLVVNPGQEDNEGDGLGDVCDPDDDNDGVLDAADNCPVDANADQEDADLDGLGDVCDPITSMFESQKIVPRDGRIYGYFGYSVSISGEYAIAGSRYGGIGGSAYVFERNAGGGWSQIQKLRDPAIVTDDEFGYSVSISGNRAIIGAPYSSNGAAYIFERDAGGVWNQVQKLTASDGESGDSLGYSVSISGDYAIVGTDGDDDGGYGSGSAYIFERNAEGVWSEVQKLTASDADVRDWFGDSVSISGDYAIVGAYNNDSGSAYIFERDAGGVWSEIQKLTASDAGASDWFGYSVSISGDHAIAGAPDEDGVATNSGASYVFERDAGGVWAEVQKLTAPDASLSDGFGTGVSVSGDYLIAGSQWDRDRGDASGSAYVFERDAGGTWTVIQKLGASDAGAYDYLGQSVSISGNHAIASAHGNDDADDSSGSAYIYCFAPDTDGDGVCDSDDDFPLDPAEWMDTDGDGTGNNTDTDDDGDGYDDGVDALPLDPDEWLDTDGDGAGDNGDNCLYEPNAGQEDSGGVASLADPSGLIADGIGDACQCGDVSNDGKVTEVDGTFINRWSVGLPPVPPLTLPPGWPPPVPLPDLPAPEKCSVFHGTECNGIDSTVIQRAVLDLPPGIQQLCEAALP